MRAKEAERKRCGEAGEEYESEDEDEEDVVPMITMPMLQMAMNDSKRSLTPAVYQKYLDMKAMFEKEGGRIQVPVQGANTGASANNSTSAQVPSAQQPVLGDDDDDDDDIYG